VLGPALFVWIGISLYNQIRQQPDLPLAWQHLKDAVKGEQAWQLGLAVLLMPVNWALETLKWHVLVNKFQRLSFLKSFEAVLSGLSLSMNTPNRIGEYGGRILYLNPEFRLRGIALTVLCSLAQLFVTLFFGWVSLIILHPFLETGTLKNAGFTEILFEVLKYGVLIALLLTGFVFFRVQWIVKLLQWIPVVKKRFSFAFVLDHLGSKNMAEILFYSLLRFIVFAVQYILVWQAFQVEINWWEGFWSVSLIFLIIAIIPSFAIAEVGIRGKVAVIVVGLFSLNTVAILTGAVGMWLLNLVLPALAGSLFLLTVKIFKER